MIRDCRDIDAADIAVGLCAVVLLVQSGQIGVDLRGEHAFTARRAQSLMKSAKTGEQVDELHLGQVNQARNLSVSLLRWRCPQTSTRVWAHDIDTGGSVNATPAVSSLCIAVVRPFANLCG